MSNNFAKINVHKSSNWKRYASNISKATLGTLPNIKYIPNCVGWKVAAATDGAGGIPVVTCCCGMMYTGWLGCTIVCLLLGNCDIMAACCGCGIATTQQSQGLCTGQRRY